MENALKNTTLTILCAASIWTWHGTLANVILFSIGTPLQVKSPSFQLYCKKFSFIVYHRIHFPDFSNDRIKILVL